MTYSGHLFATALHLILILHLTSSYSCVNNLMHIPTNYSCDSRTVLIDMARNYVVFYSHFYFLINTQPWTVLAFAYVFSIVFDEHVFPTEMLIFIL